MHDDIKKGVAFVEAVERHVAPLVRPLNFTREVAVPDRCVFASPQVSLELDYSARSGEVDVAFVRVADGIKVTLRDVLEAVAPREHQPTYLFQASSPQRLDVVLTLIADALQQHGGAVLLGDCESFARIASFAGARDREYTKGVVQNSVKRAAERAWNAGDFKRVVELYSSIRPDLSAVELKRLSLSERKVSPPGGN